MRVTDVNPGPDDGVSFGAFGTPPVGSALVFQGDDGVHGLELWASDGSAANTHLVADVGAAGGSDPDPELFTASGGLLYFRATTNATGNELFAVPISALMDSDGDGLDFAAETAAGTDPFDPDSDDDGLDDDDEVLTHGTDPLDADTDGDGYDDGEEVAGGSDPLDPESIPTAVPLVGPWGAAVLAALLALAAHRAQQRS